MNKLMNEIKETLPDGMDSLVVATNEEQIGTLIKGKVENVAEALFSHMHDPTHENGADIYRIVKLIAMNIVSNRSIYRNDFINSIIGAMPQDENEQ